MADLKMLAIDLGVKRRHLTESVASELLRQMADIPALAEQVMALEPAVQRFSSLYHDRQHVFYIGRGLDNALAMEASLKLKEVSYIMSEAYAAGELKHGTIALIEQGTLVCALLTQEQLADESHVSTKQIADIEKARRNPSYLILKALAKVVHLSLDSLMYPDLSPDEAGQNEMKLLYMNCPPEMRETLLHHTRGFAEELKELAKKLEAK